MKELTYKMNPRKRKKEIIIGFVMIFVNLFMITFTTIGFFSKILLGLLLLMSIYLLFEKFRHKNSVVVNKEGIFASIFGAEKIKWELIENVEVRQTKYSKILAINIKDIDAYLKTLTLFQRIIIKYNIKQLGFNTIILTQYSFNIPIEIVSEQIETYRNNL